MKQTSIPCIILLAMLCACSPVKKESVEDDEKSHKIVDESPAEVQVVRLEYTDFKYDLISNGTINSSNKANLRFISQEVIERIHVRNGQRVVKGQKLAELNKVRFESNLRIAENAFGRAELDFQDVLIGQGYSLKDSTQIPAEVLRIAKIRSGYAQEQNNLAMAKHNLEAATLYAPFSGVVANLTVREYNYPGSDAFCTIIDSSNPEVIFNVLESEMPLIKLNDEVVVSPFSTGSYEAYGSIIEINPSIDKNGMVRIKARVSNKDNVLVEGMNVRVLVKRLLGKSLVIPKTALVMRTNRKVVFTLQNGRAMWNYVQTAQENHDSYVVSEGLQVGDSVIYSGNINLAHESPVTTIY
ncbi:MAG: hypothetical protein BGO29_13820 [Bacteroidales bacterium 36-12]|nr:MAG: hypothetical protein BGO29_13820 [Bacteroidales bacterium 36-12]